jgi:hypothetical protein
MPAEVFLREGEVAHVHGRKPVEDWIEDRLR